MNYELKLCDAKISETLDRLASDVSKQYYSVLNSWLEKQVEEWCPEAHAMAKIKMFSLAREALLRNGFHWTQENLMCDEVITFWKDETPIARCRIELRLLNKSDGSAKCVT